MSAPFMQLYVADYLGDTRHLTTEQHGAYLLLLMTMWRSDGVLPNDPKKLARIAGCTPSRWAKICDEVLEFFDIDGASLTNKRLKFELEKASEKSIKRAVSGTKGGKAKALKTQEASLANANGLPEHSSEPEPEEDNPHTPKGAKRRKPEVALPADCPSAELIAAMQSEARAAGANLDLSFEASQFRDWWTAKDGRNRDWDACWRTWARRAINRAPQTAIAASQSRSQPSEANRWRRWLREFKANRHWPSDDAGPRPGHPACRVPAALLAEFGLAPAPANDPDLFAQGDAA